MKHKSRIGLPSSKLKHLVTIALLFILGTLVVLVTKPGYMLNIIIVYVPGLIYTFGILKRSRTKVLLFGLISLMFIIPVELLARLTDSWDVLSEFPRILGIAPVENVVYGFINIVYPLAFYEYFYDNDRNRKISKDWKLLLAMYLGLFILTFTLFAIDPSILRLNYWVLGICIFLPVFYFLVTRKLHIIKRLVVPAIVFGLMYGVHEVVSMQLGHWWWPGQYILPITLLGQIYPLEDLIIWLVLSNIAVISGYEALWD